MTNGGWRFHVVNTLRADLKMNSRPLMIYIPFQNTRKLRSGLLKLLKAEITQPHHIATMHLVSLDQIILEYQEIRKRDGKIVNLHRIKQVLLAIIEQLIESAPRLLCIPQFKPCQSLIEDHIRWLIIVEHWAGRFFQSV